MRDFSQVQSLLYFFDVYCLHFIRVDNPTVDLPSSNKKAAVATVTGGGGGQTGSQTGPRNTLAFYAGSTARVTQQTGAPFQKKPSIGVLPTSSLERPLLPRQS